MQSTFAFSKTELAKKMERNFISYARLRRAINGSVFVEEDAIAELFSGLPVATANRVYRINIDTIEGIEQKIRQVLEKYKQSKCPVLWHVGELTTNPDAVKVALKNQGFIPAKNFIGMVIDPAKLVYSMPLREFTVEHVTDRDKISDWLKPFTNSFGVADVIENHFAEYMRCLMGKSPELAWFIGYANGMPVSSASYLIDSDLLMLYSVSTLSNFRRRDYAQKITEAAIAQGLGYASHPIALYTGRDEAIPLYEKMGFVEVYELETFLYDPG